MAASLVAQTITGTIGYILYAMMIKGALDVADGGKFDIGRAFGALNVAKVLVAGLLVSLATTIGTLLCVLPGLAFSIFAFFTLFFVVDKGTDPIESIGASFTLVGRNLGDGLLTGLLAILVIVAGALLCLVGLLAAFLIVTLAGAYAFRRFRPSGRSVAITARARNPMGCCEGSRIPRAHRSARGRLWRSSRHPVDLAPQATGDHSTQATARKATNATARTLLLAAPTKSPRVRSLTARRPPQPGHGLPVSTRNGQ